MNVSDVMKQGLPIVDRNASLVEAARAMVDHDVGVLTVVDGDRLVGVVSDRDLVVRAMAENRNAANTPVHELMSVEVVCCFRDQSIEEAKGLMQEREMRHLPVVDHDYRLQGVVSREALGLGVLRRIASL